MKKISYLGPKGTYSEKAANLLAEKIEEDKELIPLVSLEAVAKSVPKQMDLGIMAYYNYLEGLVQECVDLIYENKLKIIGAQRVPIELAIGKIPGKNKVNEVYSHQKALAQSSGWLLENLPGAKQIQTASTAAGAVKVKETNAGYAIGPEKTLIDNSLEIIGSNIGNKRHGRTNYTDFYLVSEKNNVSCVDGREYLTMIAITPHVDRVGLLRDILNIIGRYQLNIEKIHSRPAIDKVKSKNEPQMFYLEIGKHQKDEYFRGCVDALKSLLTPKRKNVEVVRVLGSYEKPR